MTIDNSKLINFYAGLYDEDMEADETKKSISADLKSYAENIEVSPKAVRSGYNLYKKYRNGKDTQNDIDDLTEVENIVTNFFATTTED